MFSKTNITNFFIIACLVFAAVVGLNEVLNPWALYLFIPLAFMATLLRNGLKMNKPMVWLTLLYLWISFTCFFAYNEALAIRQMRQILGCFLLSFIIGQNTKYEKMVPWLFGVYIILFIAAVYYGATNIVGLNYDIGSDRVNDSNLNANTLAYYLLYTITSFYFLGEIIKKPFWQKTIHIVFWLMVPVSFAIAIFTASRQVLLTAPPLFLLLVYVRYFRDKKHKSWWVFILIIVVAVVVTPKAISIYDNSYLKQRSEMELYEEGRFLLLKDAFQVGIKHPIVGVGPGNYIAFSYNRHFSHCTFTELFANTGAPGALIYIIMIFVFLREQRRKLIKTQDPVFLAFLMWGLIFVFDNFFYSFYESLWLISFYVLMCSYSDYYYKTNYTN